MNAVLRGFVLDKGAYSRRLPRVNDLLKTITVEGNAEIRDQRA